VAGYALGVLPDQSARFSTEPLTSPLTLIGSSRIDLEVTGSTSTATLFASLWDLGPDIERTEGGRTSVAPSSAVLPQLQVAPVRLTGLDPDRPVRVTVALPAITHQVPVGHRLQLVVATTDQAYANPVQPADYDVRLAAEPAVTIPVLAATALNANTLNVPIPLIIVVTALVLASLIAVLWLWRRGRAIHDVAELAGVPLVVNEVVKTYGDGFRAVDGVSFGAEPGQVVGLLGPNGAGKTTVIRMLVGLIRPDSGSIYMHGKPVHAGADVLSSVGAFIEGPGFLPHLSGMANLTAYWHATGRPLEEAHLDEALAIAGLGTAINRKVRSYSHGMRQRLGIAQALVASPRLLILDEPVSSLDPEGRRDLLALIADLRASATVIFSTHVLADVERICDRVGIMDRGRLVTEGPLDELLARYARPIYRIEAEPGQAEALARLASALRETAWVDGVTDDGPGRLVVSVTDEGTASGGLLPLVVAAGLRLSVFERARPTLEDVFLRLVGRDPGERAGDGTTGAAA
jgi:ABC-2 type transport system ATP-binding protein